MSQSTAFHSGKDGKATIGDVELAILSWSLTTSVDHAEFRNSKTGRHTVIDPTHLPPVPITIIVDREFDVNPFTDGAQITVGKFLTNVKLYEAGGDGSGAPTGDPYTFPSALVKSIGHETVIDGKIGISVNLMSSGPYTYPGAVDPTDNIATYVLDEE